MKLSTLKNLKIMWTYDTTYNIKFKYIYLDEEAKKTITSSINE